MSQRAVSRPSAPVPPVISCSEPATGFSVLCGATRKTTFPMLRPDWRQRNAATASRSSEKQHT